MKKKKNFLTNLDAETKKFGIEAVVRKYKIISEAFGGEAKPVLKLIK